MSRLQDALAQEIWQAYVIGVGRSLPEGLADKMAQSVVKAMSERKYLADAAAREAEIRAELVAKVRDAISAVAVDRTTAVVDRQAEAAVDALADYYRAQLRLIRKA